MRKFVTLCVAVLLLGAAVYLWHAEHDVPQRLSAWIERSELPWLEAAAGWLDPGAGQSTAVEYVAAPVERGDVRQTVSATGSLNAVVTVEVGTQLSGQISELYADFNNEVERNQPLAQLDRLGFESRLAEARAATSMAEATVEVHRAKLERARINVLDAKAQRAVLQARLDSTKVRLASAESSLGRIMQLRESGSVSVSQAEEAVALRDTAAASLREAQAIAAAQQLAVTGARADLEAAEAELKNAKAGVPQKKAAERSAEIDLERTTIRSPVDGVVVGRNIDEGQTVAASLEAPTLFIIAGDLRQMEIYANVDEADIGRIRVGQEAVYTVDAHPGRRFPATVTSVRKSPQVSQGGVVTYTVVLSTENLEGLLLPGMTVILHITVHEAESVLKVPMAALRYAPAGAPAPETLLPADPEEGGRRATLWRIAQAGGEPEAVEVELGNDDGAHAILLEGPLEERDQVVVRESAPSVSSGLFGIRLGF